MSLRGMKEDCECGCLKNGLEEGERRWIGFVGIGSKFCFLPLVWEVFFFFCLFFLIYSNSMSTSSNETDDPALALTDLITPSR
jgi:hypothetical protein